MIVVPGSLKGVCVGWSGRRTLRAIDADIAAVYAAYPGALHVHGAARAGLDKQVDDYLKRQNANVLCFYPRYRKATYDKQAPLTRNTKMLEFMLRYAERYLYVLWDDIEEGGTWDVIKKWRAMTGQEPIRLGIAGPWK